MPMTVETLREGAFFITVFDKRKEDPGLSVVNFADGLHRWFNIPLVSLGGTRDDILAAEIPVSDTSKYLGVPLPAYTQGIKDPKRRERAERETMAVPTGHAMSLLREDLGPDATGLPLISGAYINLMPPKEEERPEDDRYTGFRNDTGGAEMIGKSIEGGIPILVVPEQIPDFIGMLATGELSPTYIRGLHTEARGYLSDYIRAT